MKRLSHILLVACLGVFIGIRVPALSQVYHQDEYKWAQIVDPVYGLQGTIPHPPLAEMAYHVWGNVFGFENLRGLPLLISVINLLLAFALVRRWFGKNSAGWTALLLLITTSSVLASVQVDIDGALLPFWSLLAFWAATDLWERNRRRGWALLGIALVGGFLTKISFGLVPLALAAETLLRRTQRVRVSWVIGAGIASVAGLALWLSPILDGIGFVRYAKSFGVLNLLHRDYFEVALLTLKSLVLLGPATLIACFASARDPRRYRVLLLFVLAQFLFYFVFIDFSHRTLERYLLVLVFPVAAIAGDAFARTIEWTVVRRRQVKALIAGLLVAGTALLLGVWKNAIPLIPKAEFVRLASHGDLRFLIPISGGSGPIGFFVPADVTVFAFVSVLLLCLGAWRWPRYASSFLPGALAVTLAFSALTTLEFTTGVLYGNASSLAKRAVTFVNNSSEISRVITYNDIGGWELGESKKYFKRYYLNPEFAQTNEKKFATFDGHFLVIGMPPISATTPSAKYFARCRNMYHDSDKRIMADVYDCRDVKYGE